MHRNQSYDSFQVRPTVNATYGASSQYIVSGAIPGNLQPRSSRNPSIADARENRLSANPAPIRLEDSLDKFEKQRRLENHPSTNYNSNGYFSPTYGYVPATIASLSGSPVKKETSSTYNIVSGISSNTNEEPIKTTSRTGGASNTHSSKTSNIEELNSQIMLKQKALEKKFEESKRLKGYNIVTNTVTNVKPSVLEGLPFGYAVRSLERNLEDINTETVFRAKGLEFERGVSLSPKKQESRAVQNSYDRNALPAGFVAGRNNFYGETEYRYANKLPQQEPLQQNQMYSAKALKNLSGIKLY